MSEQEQSVRMEKGKAVVCAPRLYYGYKRVGNMFVSYPCILPSLHVAELGIHKSTDEKARLEG